MVSPSHIAAAPRPLPTWKPCRIALARSRSVTWTSPNTVFLIAIIWPFILNLGMGNQIWFDWFDCGRLPDPVINRVCRQLVCFWYACLSQALIAEFTSDAVAGRGISLMLIAQTKQRRSKGGWCASASVRPRLYWLSPLRRCSLQWVVPLLPFHLLTLASKASVQNSQAKTLHSLKQRCKLPIQTFGWKQAKVSKLH